MLNNIGLILAEAGDAASLSGGAGWVGAGLLGAVLFWLLLKHLPDKDKQLKDLLESKDAQQLSILTAKDAQMKDLLDSRDKLLSEQLAAERNGCEARHQQNLLEWRTERETRQASHAEVMAEQQLRHDEAKELRHAIAELAQLVGLWTAVVKHFTGINFDPRKEGLTKAADPVEPVKPGV